MGRAVDRSGRLPGDRLLAELVGDLDLHYEALHLPDSNGQRLLTHTAAPGSPSADALRLLI